MSGNLGINTKPLGNLNRWLRKLLYTQVPAASDKRQAPTSQDTFDYENSSNPVDTFFKLVFKGIDRAMKSLFYTKVAQPKTDTSKRQASTTKSASEQAAASTTATTSTRGQTLAARLRAVDAVWGRKQDQKLVAPAASQQPVAAKDAPVDLVSQLTLVMDKVAATLLRSANQSMALTVAHPDSPPRIAAPRARALTHK